MNRNSSLKLNEYVAHDKFKVSFILSLLVTIILILIDRLYENGLMDVTIRITLELQKYNLFWVATFFSYIFFFFLYGYIFFAMTLRRNQESNYTLLFGVLFLFYIQALMKMVLLGSRPIFNHPVIQQEHCICDYGKPSGHGIIGLGTMLLIYFDIINNHKVSELGKFFMKLVIAVFTFMIAVSRLYLGAHSINQVFLGWSIGLTCFFGLRQLNDYIQKYIIWPIFYKTSFRNKRAIFHVLFHFMWTNYLLFFAWTYRYTTFEKADNEFFNFKNCVYCVENMGQNFSTKIIKEASIFNLFFGMMIGIYISRFKHFDHAGFYAEEDFGKYVLRVMILALMMSPLVIGFIIHIDNVILKFLRVFILCIICGILMTSTFFDLLKMFDLEIHEKEELKEKDDSGLTVVDYS